VEVALMSRMADEPKRFEDRLKKLVKQKPAKRSGVDDSHP